MVRLRVVAAALVALGALMGCDDEPEPNISDPTPSVTPSPTEPTTASSSPQPVLGVEETVRAFIDEWNAALASGDTTALEAFAADGCRGCDELTRVIEDIVDSGGSFEGGEWTITRLEVVEESEKDAAIYLAVDVAPGSTVTASGSPPTSYPATNHLLNLEVTRVGNDWRFTVIELVT